MKAEPGARGIADGVTDALAEFVADSEYAALPAAVRDAGKVVFLDGLGCLVAGVVSPVAGILLDYSEDVSGSGPCTVVGTGHRVPATMAAFVNGALLHANDYEVQGRPPTHGTSNLLPVALSLSETYGGDGVGVLTAFVVGWEVQARIRTAAARADFHAFHPPGIFGPMGAAATAGKLLGLDAAQMRMAFGIAASRTGGLFANNGTMVKSTHPGNAGRMGLEAALLAKRGFVSNPDIFGVPHGYVEALFGTAFDASAVLEGIGTQYHLVEPGFDIKAYPAEIYMQWVIESVVQLRQREQLTPADIVKLELEVPTVRDDLSRPWPVSGLDGKFSYEYCAAVALTQERPGLASFTDKVRFSPIVEDTLGKIVVRQDPAIPHDQDRTWVVARAELRDGRTVENTCSAYRGSRLNPMTREERLAKVWDCVRNGLAEEQFALLVAATESLEEPGSLPRILELLGSIRIRGDGDSDLA